MFLKNGLQSFLKITPAINIGTFYKTFPGFLDTALRIPLENHPGIPVGKPTGIPLILHTEFSLNLLDVFLKISLEKLHRVSLK